MVQLGKRDIFNPRKLEGHQAKSTTRKKRKKRRAGQRHERNLKKKLKSCSGQKGGGSHESVILQGVGRCVDTENNNIWSRKPGGDGIGPDGAD